MRIWVGRLMQEDEYYWEGLKWILQELSVIIKEYLEKLHTNLKFASTKAIEDAIKKESRKRKLAQQKH